MAFVKGAAPVLGAVSIINNSLKNASVVIALALSLFSGITVPIITLELKLHTKWNIGKMPLSEVPTPVMQIIQD